MVAEVEAARKDGDTLGGVVEVLAYGLPPGLGSHVHWDRRLDAQLAAALMGIQAIKGVEVGDGFRTAAPPRLGRARRDGARRRRRDPAPHRPRRRHRGRHVHRRRAAGARGDEADHAPCPARWTPSTSPPDEPAKAIHQRSDVCAVPAAGVVAEAMVALVLAAGVLEKFGGDCVAETAPQPRGYLDGDPRGAALVVTRHRPPAGRPRRAAGVGQDHGGRSWSRRGSGSPLRDTDAAIEAAAGPQHLRHLRRGRRGGVPRARAARGGQASLAEPRRGAVARAAEPCWTRTPERLLAGHDRRLPATWASPTRPSASGFDRSRPLLALQPRAAWVRLMDERRADLRAAATVHCVDTAGRTPEDVAAEIVTAAGGQHRE